VFTDCQISFTGRLSCKFPVEQLLNSPPRLKRVATVPCEMVALKNRNDSELSEANRHVRLSCSR